MNLSIRVLLHSVIELHSKRCVAICCEPHSHAVAYDSISPNKTSRSPINQSLQLKIHVCNSFDRARGWTALFHELHTASFDCMRRGV